MNQKPLKFIFNLKTDNDGLFLTSPDCDFSLSLGKDEAKDMKTILSSLSPTLDFYFRTCHDINIERLLMGIEDTALSLEAGQRLTCLITPK